MESQKGSCKDYSPTKNWGYMDFHVSLGECRGLGLGSRGQWHLAGALCGYMRVYMGYVGLKINPIGAIEGGLHRLRGWASGARFGGLDVTERLMV